jgi:hypothetical protein
MGSGGGKGGSDGGPSGVHLIWFTDQLQGNQGNRNEIANRTLVNPNAIRLDDSYADFSNSS